LWLGAPALAVTSAPVRTRCFWTVCARAAALALPTLHNANTTTSTPPTPSQCLILSNAVIMITMMRDWKHHHRNVSRIKMPYIDTPISTDLTLNSACCRHGGTSAVMKLVKLFAESVRLVFSMISTRVHRRRVVLYAGSSVVITHGPTPPREKTAIVQKRHRKKGID
jgi:hypothetical protein